MTFVLEMLASLGLVAAVFLAMEAGRRAGRRRREQDPENSHAGVAAIEAAVFGLLGLLLAFVFSGAWTRFDARRDLIVLEANAIGTAWLRLDLLPAAEREALRGEFRDYLDLRIAAARAGAKSASPEIAAAQRRIWDRAMAQTKAASDVRVAATLLPALNDMFDVASTRYVAAGTHPPRVVFVMMIALSLAGATLAGYGMAAARTRSWLHIACFAGSLLATIYVSLEMEFPRRGFIRVDHYDQVLRDLRAGME